MRTPALLVALVACALALMNEHNRGHKGSAGHSDTLRPDPAVGLLSEEAQSAATARASASRTKKRKSSIRLNHGRAQAKTAAAPLVPAGFSQKANLTVPPALIELGETSDGRAENRSGLLADGRSGLLAALEEKSIEDGISVSIAEDEMEMLSVYDKVKQMYAGLPDAPMRYKAAAAVLVVAVLCVKLALACLCFRYCRRRQEELALRAAVNALCSPRAKSPASKATVAPEKRSLAVEAAREKGDIGEGEGADCMPAPQYFGLAADACAAPSLDDGKAATPVSIDT